MTRAMRRFVGIDLGREPVPDETIICKFRHLLEAQLVNLYMSRRLLLRATLGRCIRRASLVRFETSFVVRPHSSRY